MLLVHKHPLQLYILNNYTYLHYEVHLFNVFFFGLNSILSDTNIETSTFFLFVFACYTVACILSLILIISFFWTLLYISNRISQAFWLQATESTLVILLEIYLENKFTKGYLIAHSITVFQGEPKNLSRGLWSQDNIHSPHRTSLRHGPSHLGTDPAVHTPNTEQWRTRWEPLPLLFWKLDFSPPQHTTPSRKRLHTALLSYTVFFQIKVWLTEPRSIPLL